MTTPGPVVPRARRNGSPPRPWPRCMADLRPGPARRRGGLSARRGQVDPGGPCRRGTRRSRRAGHGRGADQQPGRRPDRPAGRGRRRPGHRQAVGADYLPAPRVTRHASVSVAAADPRPGRLPGDRRNRREVGDGRRRARGPGPSSTRPTRCARTCCCGSPAGSSGALFVGDPGQLDPFSTVEIDRWTGLTWDPMQSAVAVLLRNNPDFPVRRLPVSWRLPRSAAPVVAEAFYPFTGFLAGTAPEQRRLEFATRALRVRPGGRGRRDRSGVGLGAVRAARQAHGPHRRRGRRGVRGAGRADPAARRGPVSERAPTGEPVTADRIAIGTAHRDQAQAIRSRLGPLSAAGVDRGHRQPAAGPRVRRDDRAASAVRAGSTRPRSIWRPAACAC